LETQKEPILYVDDEQENLTGFKYSFMFDFEVYTALTVEEAYRILAETNIKVVVSDHKMPVMTGAEFLKDISEKYPDIIRIMLTAYSDVNIALKAINEGKVYQYLTKPWNKEDMGIHLKTAIEAFNLKVENSNLINKLQRSNNDLQSTNHALKYEVESHRKTLLSLERSEKRFKNIFESSQDSILILNTSFEIIEANPAFLDSVSLTKKEIVNHKLDLFISDYEDLLKHLSTGDQTQNVLFECNLMKEGEHICPVEINAKEIDYNGSPAIIALLRDVSERKMLEQKMFDAVLRAEERERKRISEELKEDMNPFFSKIRMHLNSLTDSDLTTKQDSIVQEIKELIGETAHSMKEISNSLSPQLLSSYGISEAIKNLTSQVSRFINIHFVTDISKTRFPATIEIIYYRIIRELITFSIKKTKSKNIFLKIFYDDNVLSLSYSDDSNNSYEKLLNEESFFYVLSRVKTVEGKHTIDKTPLGGISFNLKVHTIFFNDIEAI